MRSDYEKIKKENIREYGEGTRHLSFLGKLYTDRTHFIFELLQNAEDARASKILFKLFGDRLEVIHNGRPFNEGDVRGVCGVGEGTKAEDLTQIGKFGIGFKSVYAYTSTPEIHSGDENFGIENYVRPYSVKRRDVEASWTTLFVFRFNAEGMDRERACQEIGKCLRDLSARTLLFLRKIKEIEYKLPDGTGIYLREETSRSPARQVTVIGQNSGQDEDETWLIFERAVRVPDGISEVCVEVGFRLEMESRDRPERIVKINGAPLVVYFPTEKESGLGFLIQGPYRTTPARDNVPKDDQWNKTLIEETAELVAESLESLKNTGLLSVSLLEALPIRTEDFQEDGMFYPIFSRVRKALLSERLLPASDGTFVTAQDAKLVRGARLAKLLGQESLNTLFRSDGKTRWLTGRITQDLTPDLRSYLTKELNIEEVDPQMFAQRLSEDFLSAQTDEWFIEFYNFLVEQKALWRPPRREWEEGGVLRHKPILRLQDGSHIVPFRNATSPNAHLAGKTDAETSLPIVKIILSSDDEARKFLKDLGIPELDIVEEAIEKILPKYADTSVTVGTEENEHDLKKIERAYSTDSSWDKKNRLRSALCATPFILGDRLNRGETAYRKPGQVYFLSDELRIYFTGNDSFAFVSTNHQYAQLLRKLGVEESVRICRKPNDSKQRVTISSYYGWHQRGLNGFDPDICVDGLEYAMSDPFLEKSVFIWNEIAVPNSGCIRGIVEKSTRQTYEGSEEEERTSEFGELLTDNAWLPDLNGHFHKPSELTLDDLPKTFVRDEKLADQLGMKKNVVAKLAEEIGVKTEDIEAIRKNPEEFERWKDAMKKKSKPSFPTRAVSNSDRRQKRLTEQHGSAPEKEYETRERSVRITRGEIEPSVYLRNQYTNEDDQMICQICKEEMPFRKRDGEHYFEAVEALSDFNKEQEAQFLALCPLCAAMYKEFVKRDETALEELYHALKNSDELEVPLTLGEWETSIRFVETHSSDMKTSLYQSARASKQPAIHQPATASDRKACQSATQPARRSD